MNTSQTGKKTEREEAALTLLVELCRVPRHIASRTYPEERLSFARRAMCMLGGPPKPATEAAGRNTPEYIHPASPGMMPKRFRWLNEWLHYPAADKDINGESMPMYRVTAGEFCEATDLYLCSPWEYAPLITSILCRPVGELYDEKLARQRAETMHRLPVRVVQHVFSLMNQTHRYLRRLFPGCYAVTGITGKLRAARQVEQEMQSVSPTTWNDMLFEAAGYLPSEINATRSMPLYSFMQLLHAKCKRKL